MEIEGTSQAASTDDTGQFRLEGLLPGEANVTISAKGFHPERKTAKLDLKEPASLGEIQLRPVETDPAAVAKPFDTPAPVGAITPDGSATVEPATSIPRDDFRKRLERAHAKTGDVQVSLAWDNKNDIDLYVQSPSGEVIYYQNRHSRCGGELDVDMNAGIGLTNEPVENVYWPLHTAPRGKYKVLAHHYAKHGAADPTKFRVAVKNGDEVKYYTGQINSQQKVLVCEFERLTGPEPPLIADNNPTPAITPDGSATVKPATSIPRDDFRIRLEREHAKTGDVQVSMAWDNKNDLDLYVQSPSGEVVWARNKHAQCGGEMDVDANGVANANSSDSRLTNTPVENIYWPLHTAPRGKYKVLANYCRNHGGSDPTDVRWAVKNGGEVKYYKAKLNPNDKITICEFERLTGPEPPLITSGNTSAQNPLALSDWGCEQYRTNSGINGGNGGNGTSGGNANPKHPPGSNRPQEEQAAERLRLAKKMLKSNPDAGKRWLKDVAKLYPQTQAGKQSQSMLDGLAAGTGGETIPGETTWLADLIPVRKNVTDNAWQTRAVKIEGKPKRHSFWTRTNIPLPPVSVEYALGRRYAQLSGAVGIEDSGQADRTRVTTAFQILGDGKVLWSSDAIREPGKTQPFSVDVSKVNNLKIITGSNRVPSHYPVWIDPSLVARGETK